MGGTQSKPEKQIKKELNLANFLDVIATKYILTQNFEDLKNLGRKEYCNKLIILTSDVIKKFFKDKDITYLAERVDPNGIPHNAMTTENIIYLDTNSLKPTSSRFSKREQEAFKKEQDSQIKAQLFKQYQKKLTIQKLEAQKLEAQKLAAQKFTTHLPSTQQLVAQMFTTRGRGGGGVRDYLKALLASEEPSPPKVEKIKTPSMKKTLLSELDVRNPTQKDRMCKGIAKIYIKVAHLYASISKTINPRYRFKDSQGNVKDYSIWNKKKIPKGAVPYFVEDSLCSRRRKALAHTDVGGDITVTLAKVCNLNKRMKTLTEENHPGHLIDYGKKKYL